MTTDTITLTSPDDILAAVPFVLGFHPTDSAVVLCLHDNRLVLTQRIDLPAPAHAHGAAGALLPTIRSSDAHKVILLGYESTPDSSRPVLEALAALLDQDTDITVLDRIVVRDGRWWSVDCPDPGCCPPEGTPLPAPVDASHITAEFVGAGMTPLRDRDVLARSVEPGPRADAVADLVDVLLAVDPDSDSGDVDSQDELLAAWARILTPDRVPAPVSPIDATLAAVSLKDVTVRDGLVAWLTPGLLPADLVSDTVRDITAHLDRVWASTCEATAATDPREPEGVVHRRRQARLVELCSCLPDPMATPSLTVLASLAWWRGDGATARVALDRALRADPDYRLAQLLVRVVELGIHPHP
ncbi:DUF4192 domain-containing protein [Ornithinimicrobium sediminis]|uniref:DUF4192 domain-containing protein n=1 Tax=Ornithinimicrobium sediminis TaxID=2904603 RepID=UPI001E531D8A|nr:DUF4192 domain-containing protein [Ornithinimicrobium sediminis]MCE0488145.1 DUF4192 domain-containing protein [Ornithinimicrobium sediminis]